MPAEGMFDRRKAKTHSSTRAVDQGDIAEYSRNFYEQYFLGSLPDYPKGGNPSMGSEKCFFMNFKNFAFSQNWICCLGAIFNANTSAPVFT